VPEGVKGAGLKEQVYVPDGSKAERLPGLKYTRLRQTMVDTLKDLLQAEKRAN
jgi:NADPH-dependent methylglyoxal reductase